MHDLENSEAESVTSNCCWIFEASTSAKSFGEHSLKVVLRGGQISKSSYNSTEAEFLDVVAEILSDEILRCFWILDSKFESLHRPRRGPM
jgi:hypothetical protein